MFSATRVAALVAVLALTGSLAFVAISTPEGPTPLPGAVMDDIDPADFGGFTGTMDCRQGEYGDLTTFEWGSLTEGETYAECTIETNDPRFSGNNRSIHIYYRYDRLPTRGVRNVASVITNDEGTWVADRMVGYQQPESDAMRYAGEYHGIGAYEGLSAMLFLTQDDFGLSFDREGVIFPGELPEAPELPTEAAPAVD